VDCGLRISKKTDLHQFWLSCGLAADAWATAIERYEQYYRLILDHNQADGLMGQVTREDFYLKHIADSLLVLLVYPELFAGPVRLADVGCGAGLPGIVLAIALPELQLTAIESNNKKADFVKLAVSELGLTERERVEVVARRSREIAYQERYRGLFDVVTARAVGPSKRIIRENRMLLASNGSLVLYKTPPAVADELPLARREADKHKLTIETSETITLPAEAGQRQFIRVLSQNH
jgi:16S rRNA (guanine527-N7)-methyltransferase